MAGALGNLVPLVILFIILAVAGFIGYQVYVWSQDMADRGRSHLEKKNMSFTRDGGLKVGVKELKDEAYADKTQNILVNVWNNAAFPNYKSSLGWNSTQAGSGSKTAGSSSSRPSMSHSASSQARVHSHSSSRPSQSRPASSTTGAASLSPPVAPRTASRRSASPVPGSFD